MPFPTSGSGRQEKADSGLSLMIPSIRQWPAAVVDAKVKNFNRMHTHLARLEAERAQADDVVLLDDRGLLTESRGANVFLVRGGALYTPRGGILEGITRETVFEIAAELGIPAGSTTSRPTISTPPTKRSSVAPPAASPRRGGGRAAGRLWESRIDHAKDPRALLGAASKRPGRDTDSGLMVGASPES